MERAATSDEVASEALLAVLLKTGAPGCDVMELSRRLLSAFGSLKALLTSDWRALEERIRRHNADYPSRPISGIGHVKCLELAAAFALGTRALRLTPEELKQKAIHTAAAAAEVFRTVLGPEEQQENFFVLPFDTHFHPLSEPLRVTRGTRDATDVHVREVFREAIRWNARGVVVAHNHPTGDPTPSREDLSLTRRLVKTAKVLGIEFMDHLVLGGTGAVPFYVSIRRQVRW